MPVTIGKKERGKQWKKYALKELSMLQRGLSSR